MITWDSVDLPDPFGPMTAWTSPDGTVRSTPVRISRPATPARSPVMTSSLIGRPRSSACPRAGTVSMIRSQARSCGALAHDDVVAVDDHVVHGHGPGGGQRLRRPVQQRERRPVLPALDLALV